MDKYMSANAVFSKFSRNYMESKKDLPIRPSEMAVINIITQRDGLYTPLMIAELLGVSKPMITAHIRALSKKGYIRKAGSCEDRRSFHVLPTEKAESLAFEFKEKQEKYLKEIESKLPHGEFDELLRLVEKVLPLMEETKEKENAK